MDMFEPMTKQRLIGRAGGNSDMGLDVPRDKERHATQAALAQQQGGVRKEPVLLIKTDKGYELLEGWHRTIQHFAKYPDGYTGPAYVAVAQQGVTEDKEKNHWYDAGVKDATRGARPNPRTYLPTLKDKQAKHPEEVDFYMNGYKSVPQGVAEDLGKQQYLWHGSRQKIPMLEPRQSVDTGGASGSNQNAIYATSDPKVAIAMGLTTPGSDTGMFPNDPQMVLFSGKIRKGENVYLHKLPMNGPDGKPQFAQGGNSREFHSIPGVKGIKPTEIKTVPVNKYLNLIRPATPADLELRKKYMKQGVTESLRVDVPNEEWLNGAIAYAKQKSPTHYGLPYMGKTTATVRQVEVPLIVLRQIPGMRREQQNVRYDDLAAIEKIMSDTGKLPIHSHSNEEYKPFINVAYDGSAWVNEGNHRIMAAYRLGWDKLPVEISYFDGGERVESGPMYPGKIGL